MKFSFISALSFILILSPNILANSFQNKLDHLKNKISEVEEASIKTKGYLKKSTEVDIQVAKWFVDLIDWELKNLDLMKDALVANEIFRKRKVDDTEKERRYQFHINYELNSSIRVLEKSLDRIRQKRKWPEYQGIDWDKMLFKDGVFKVDDKTVFPLGFNMVKKRLVDLKKHPEWKPEDKRLLQKFMSEMQNVGVNLVEVGVSMPSLLTKDKKISKERIENVLSKFRNYEKMGLKTSILFHWRGMKKGDLNALYPDIENYGGNGLSIDFDHPGFQDIILKASEQLMPELAKIKSLVSIDLANEAFFSMEKWSPYSLRKYQTWLSKKHMDIDELNRVWKTQYKIFSDIPLPKDKKRAKCSPGEWYDRVTFHNLRVTNAFTFVQNQIKIYLPNVAIHIKIQDNNSLGPRPFSVEDGMDREMLAPMSSLHGLDTRPLPVTEPRMAAAGYDSSPYGFHWLGQSFLYDYLSSLKPYRPLVDFEYHAFSINPIRIPDIHPHHARATLWLAHMHGLIGNMAWYWQHRYGPNPFHKKYFATWFYGSLSTQPELTAEYFHTMHKLNMHTEEIRALATKVKRPIRLLVSNSSYIHNQNHINALHRIYEGTSFHSLGIGFVTEKMLQEDGVPDDCKLLIIPDIEYLNKNALNVLEKLDQTKIKVMQYGKRKIKFDEHGFKHEQENLNFLNDISVIKEADALTLSKKMSSHVLHLKQELDIHVTDQQEEHIFGLMQRQVKLGDKVILLLVNVSNQSHNISLRLKNRTYLNAYDLVNRENIHGRKVQIDKYAVRLFKIER